MDYVSEYDGFVGIWAHPTGHLPQVILSNNPADRDSYITDSTRCILCGV